MVAATLALGVSAQVPAPRENHPIRLRAATFTPARGEQPAIRPELTSPGFAANERGYFLVQFAGPVMDAWKSNVAASGAELFNYIPDFAFKVRMTPAAAQRVARLPEVVWVGVFHPAYKLPPDIARDAQPRPYIARIEPDVDLTTAEAAIAATGARIVRRDDRSMTIIADAAQLDAVARVLDVSSIENAVLRQKHNEFGGGVIMGATAVHAAGFDGSTQTVAISDTGLGTGQSASAHADLPASRIAAVFNWPGTPSTCFDSIVNDGARDVDSGHGTHVATTAVGAGSGGVARGTAPGARLIFQALENWAEPSLLCSLLYNIVPGYYLVGIPTDVGALFQQAYNGGARVHSNSWGSESGGAYTADSVNTDAFVWAHPDLAVTFSAGNSGTDSNADGVVDPTSLNAPATAKNVISIGASENDRQSQYACDTNLTATACATQGGQNNIFSYAAFTGRYPVNPLKDDPSAGNSEQMAAFSSRGPTADGRIKPDVVAPGTWILSGYADPFQQQYDSSPNPQNGEYQWGGWGYPLSATHKYMGGTSMAAPLVAGGAAVVRDYYQKARAHEASAALVKATLVNAAIDLLDENNDGVNDNFYPIPNIHEGWGRVDLVEATKPGRQFVDQAIGLSTAATATYTLPVESDTRPLKVTLAWTDYPSTTAAARNLVNDLDLIVSAPDGTTYRGNVFSGGWSTSGGAADRTNNLENVYVLVPVAGTWTISVSGYNVPNGPQPFALVADTFFDGSTVDLPSVAVVAVANAAEAGLANGAFRVTRNGDLSEPLAVSYVLGGSATSAADYVALSGVVTLPAESAEATVLVEPIDDATVESDETVMLTLVGDASYVVGSPRTASVIITSDDSPPDLTIASVTAPGTGAPGATIAVGDTTSNLGTVSAPVSQTGFYLSSNTVLDALDVLLGNRTTASLAPGSSESRSTDVQIPATTAVGTYYVIARADWNDAVTETQETNNTRASLAIVIAGPDLIVTALSAPATAAPGGLVSVSDTTKNNGGGSAAASLIAFYLSADGAWDGADTRLGSREVPMLAPAASHASATALTIPATTAAGSYFIIARADDAATVAETSETNNLRFAGMVKIGADLTVSALSGPATSAPGASIVVSDTTANTGSGGADVSTTAFYLSLNTLLDAQDLPIGSRAVASLATGATESRSTTLQIPVTTAIGAYYLIAKADGNDAVLEVQETNNTRASGQPIVVGPDLVVAAAAAPTTAAPGSVVTVSDTTQNSGGGSAAAALTAFYLSTDGAWDAADVRLGSRTVPVLGAGTSSAGVTAVTLPSSTVPGSYYIIVRADDAGAVVETLESNNLRFSNLVKIGADLTVTALTVPASVAAGGSLAISDTTGNPSPAGAGVSATGFYLSSNSFLDAADVRLGARSVPALGPGVSDSASTTLTVPAATAYGTYYVIAKADESSALAETNESNNTRVSALVKVGPDLVVTSVQAPPLAGAGLTMSVTQTITNSGGAPSLAGEAVLYLSKNGTIDAGDYLLARPTVPSLAAGAVDTASMTVTIPADVVMGTYYVITQIDAGNTTIESVESNNTGQSSFIWIGPDLVLSALSGPASAAAGTSVTVNATLSNTGGGVAGPSSITFYLSPRFSYDATDVTLGTQPVVALVPGASQGAATSLAIPATLAPGTYYVIAKADGAGVITETFETNNARLIPLQVVAQ